MIRLLVAMALGPEKYFIDRVDADLAPLSNEEIQTLIHGEQDEMREIVVKHKLPNSLLDLIGMMFDGVPTSSFINPPKPEDVPPKRSMH